MQKGELTAGKPLLDEELIQNSDWVLTTYETLRDYQHSFGRIRWAAAVFDEAQKIKNPAAKLTDAALAMNIGFALMMTGTPVENRPADVWSIIDRAQPGRLGTLKEFSNRYEADTHNAGASLSHLSDDLYGRSEQPGPPLMLRRLKADHIPELPEQRIHRYVVDMPSPQADTYASVIARPPADRGNMLQVIQLLRSVSLHPFHHAGMNVHDYVSCSARLAKTFQILEDIRERGEKALIFVESLEMQEFLVVALRQQFRLPEDVLVVNGKVAGRSRQDRVNAFQEQKGFDVMVLSPRAGGVGLTLTAANHVIHLSRWWNPAVEDQCTDRVFRIGQHRTVHVHLPMARHPALGDYSFDFRLDQLLRKKRAVNQRILAPTGASREDFRALFEDTVERARTRL